MQFIQYATYEMEFSFATHYLIDMYNKKKI